MKAGVVTNPNNIGRSCECEITFLTFDAYSRVKSEVSGATIRNVRKDGMKFVRVAEENLV